MDHDFQASSELGATVFMISPPPDKHRVPYGLLSIDQ
jgi:hypothetical protein